MKTPSVVLLLASLLLVSCGKEEVKAPAQGPAATAKKPEPAKPKAPEKKVPIVAPQGKLPVMDPDKAKFIAVPSTPKDAEVKKTEKTDAPKAEIKKVETPKDEVRKADALPAEVKKAGGSASGDAGKSQ